MMENCAKKIDYIDLIKKIIMIVVAVMITRILNISGPAKYVALFFMSFFLALPYVKRFDTKWLVILVPNFFYVIWGGIMALGHRNISIYTVKIAAFLVIPGVVALLLFTALKTRIKWFIDVFFIISVLYYLISTLPGFDLVDLMESIYAFSFGAFVVYYFNQKKWVHFLVAVIALILGHKFIAWYAGLFCVAIILLSKLIKNEKIKYALMMTSFVLFELMAYWFVSVDFLNLFGEAKFQLFDSISSARMSAWAQFKEELDFSIAFPGYGMGYTLSHMSQWNWLGFDHIQNDYLQIYAEVGFVGMFVYLFLFSFLPMHHCFMNKSIDKCVGFWGLLFYTYILWITDNTQIYITYWIPMWLMMLDTIFYEELEYERIVPATASICPIMGVNIAVVNMTSLLKMIHKNIEKWSGQYICVSNVHTTVTAYEQKDYLDIQNNAVLAIPDGGPLSAEGRRRGYANMSRTTGPDLMVEIMKTSVEHGYKHYFYGSTQETLDLLRAKLEANYPGIQIVGMFSPPFGAVSDEEDELYVQAINETKPDFVWVGLGAPKQEIWMAAHRDKVCGLMIGVGAGFDYLAGNIKRAPKWMQDNSLEWLYRLIQEPKRLLARYMKTNIKFLWLAVFRGK